MIFVSFFPIYSCVKIWTPIVTHPTPGIMISTKLNLHFLRMFAHKFQLFGPKVFWEENFKKIPTFFYYFLIISHCKWLWTFIFTNLNPLYQIMLCAKFGWKWPIGSGEEVVRKCQKFTDGRTDGKTGWPDKKDQKSAGVLKMWMIMYLYVIYSKSVF